MTGNPLLPVAEAQARLLALAAPVATETVALREAAGRWSAADVLARRTQPAADLSAMDGYAIRVAELPGPWRIVGESAAGGGFERALDPGEAARIFTGAPLPEGADTILVQEEAARDGDRLTLAGHGPPAIGVHIRRAGSDFSAGAVLVARGERLSAARIGLAAIGGHGALGVNRRVRVAIVSTGNELVPPGGPIEGLMLPSSNAPMLAALLADLPVEIADCGIVRDELDALTAALTHAARTADIVVTIGGASVGDHDLVRPALLAAGATIDFWKIAMRPGKPLLAGRLGDAVTLGLPGNPVSAFVTATLFLKPLIAALGGATDPLPATHKAVLGAGLPAGGERAEYMRARIKKGRVFPLLSRDSAMLGVLAGADALLLRAAHAKAAAAGELVEIISLA